MDKPHILIKKEPQDTTNLPLAVKTKQNKANKGGITGLLLTHIVQKSYSLPFYFYKLVVYLFLYNNNNNFIILLILNSLLSTWRLQRQ